MKIHGYCEKCRRVKLVRVSGAGMAMFIASRIATGTCDSCQQKEDDERRARRQR